MDRDPDWLVTRTVDGGIVAVGMCGGIGGETFVGWHDVRREYPSVSGVGSFRGKVKRIRRQAKRLARNRVLRRIARTAMVVAKMTPYGAAASQAVEVAKKATQLARGEVDAMEAAESMARNYVSQRGGVVTERRADRALRMLVSGY